jgi:hypothetical protein
MAPIKTSEKNSLTDMLALATSIATAAHQGQFYADGLPYITHPAAVANHARLIGYNEVVQTVAWLHDVIEDTPIIADDLHKQFPKFIVDAVESVTYVQEAGLDKIDQARSNPIGHVVKFCDASCNFGFSVVKGTKLGKNPRDILVDRYPDYIARLLPDLPSPSQIDDICIRQLK